MELISSRGGRRAAGARIQEHRKVVRHRIKQQAKHWLCKAIGVEPGFSFVFASVFSFTLAFFILSVLAQNHSTENVKLAVLGMSPKEMVLLQTLFMPKYFPSSWRRVLAQWPSTVFPPSVSPDSPSIALSNWILFEKEWGKMLPGPTCRFKNYPPSAKGQQSSVVLGCQTSGLRDYVAFLDVAFSNETQRKEAGEVTLLSLIPKSLNCFPCWVMWLWQEEATKYSK